MEFIRRCLQHVPPTGFHRIRYYGLWSPTRRSHLRRVLLLLSTVRTGLIAAIAAAADSAKAAVLTFGVCRCPRCQSRTQVFSELR